MCSPGFTIPNFSLAWLSINSGVLTTWSCCWSSCFFLFASSSWSLRVVTIWLFCLKVIIEVAIFLITHSKMSTIPRSKIDFVLTKRMFTDIIGSN